MNEIEEQRIRKWIEDWVAAAPVLESARRQAIRHADTAAAIEQLSDAFESARRQWPPSATSGLVEQQRWFARLRP